jgi:NET1-associated nuclear protein 1 (U3 small nucleolar RNA-associated protein 17)
MVWRCESVGFFRSLPAGDISFSADGSLLAVTFGPTLTVWVPETNLLKCSLTEVHPKINLRYVVKELFTSVMSEVMSYM